jgi:hypothetical protein
MIDKEACIPSQNLANGSSHRNGANGAANGKDDVDMDDEEL